LTCDASNRASARTIELNGGVLKREGWSELEQTQQRWYWIKLGEG
jgi:predicted acetyltransferase